MNIIHDERLILLAKIKRGDQGHFKPLRTCFITPPPDA